MHFFYSKICDLVLFKESVEVWFQKVINSQPFLIFKNL